MGLANEKFLMIGRQGFSQVLVGMIPLFKAKNEKGRQRNACPEKVRFLLHFAPGCISMENSQPADTDARRKQWRWTNPLYGMEYVELRGERSHGS
jgi:hypothetical protein